MEDEYHTIQELYEHRHTLFAYICDLLPNESWKSRVHSDGSSYEGWFIAGLRYLPGEQISYHFPDSWWNKVHAHILKKAPPFDGHTSEDVLKRFQKLMGNE